MGVFVGLLLLGFLVQRLYILPAQTIWQQLRPTAETFQERLDVNEAMKQKVGVIDLQPGLYRRESQISDILVHQMLRFGGVPSRRPVPFVYEIQGAGQTVRVTGTVDQQGSVLVLRPDHKTPYLRSVERHRIGKASSTYFTLGGTGPLSQVAGSKLWIRQAQSFDFSDEQGAGASRIP